MVSTLQTASAGSVGLAIALSAALFLPAAADPVNTVKLAVVVLSALLCALLLLWRAVAEREVALPHGPAVAALGLLLLGLSTAAVLAPSWTTATWGTPGRLSGLLLYTAASMLFVSTCTAGSTGRTVIVYCIAAAGVFTAAYGCLQYLGLDAVNWANEFNPIIASLGNPNFASGYLGVCTPVTAGLALLQPARSPRQIMIASAAILMLATSILSGASQGPLAAAAGGCVLVLAAGLRNTGRARQMLVVGVGGTAGLGLVMLALGAAGSGPAAPLFGQTSFTTRRWYWSAALEMWSQRPLTGVGLDSYGMSWRTARPLENVLSLGGGDFSDAAHNVPLHLLATGGLVSFIPYMIFTLIVLASLLRGLLRLDGTSQIALGAFGGGWVAYQVQSLVSIDQVPLVVLNFVLAAAVLTVSGSVRTVDVRLPGALAVPAASLRRRPAVIQRVRVLTPADMVGLGALVVGGLSLAALTLVPLRADLALLSGEAALARGEGNASLAAFTRATELEPGRTRHWARLGDVLNIARQPESALEAYDRALAVDPSNIGVLQNAAGLAEEQGQLERARAYHQQAVRRDPDSPKTLAAAAEFELRHSGAQTALELLEPAVARTPRFAQLWTPLGDARQVLGDPRGAILAYEQALALEPTQAKAAAELQKLQG